MNMKMKAPKTKIAAGWAFALIVPFIISSCTSRFEEFNKDATGLYQSQLNYDFKSIGAPLQQAQLNIYVYQPAWDFQLQQNLIADVYSGYMMSPTPFIGNINNTNYALVDGWNGFPWSDGYLKVMLPTGQAMATAKQYGYKDFYAWAKILRVAGMHRVSDIYGPIVYSKFGVINADGSTDYDSQQTVYNEFFADLDSAIQTLTPLAQNNAPQTFTKFDYVYGGSFKQWVQFANTLRLRLAIRISSVNPSLAKQQGETALANPIGLLASPGDNFDVNIGSTTHPLNVINNSWGDIRLGAPISSILGGYHDPRLAKYAAYATDAVFAPNTYEGIRNGINIAAKGDYEGYSMLANFPIYSAANGSANFVTLMTSAEAWFLKAEAALYGWAGAGSIQSNYEQGINDSFTQYGLSATSYIADNTSTPAPYVDPKNAANNVNPGDAHLSTITIKWDNAATPAQQLERIITQKWIAMYPEGQEAWSEFRRTTYPKLFPVVVNNSQGKISTNKFIRRINFPISEYSNNLPGVTKAVTLLGGGLPDNGGTPLWWDTNP